MSGLPCGTGSAGWAAREVDCVMCPTADDVREFAHESPEMRVAQAVTGHVFIWDATEALHMQMERAIGIHFKLGQGYNDRVYTADEVIEWLNELS